MNTKINIPCNAQFYKVNEKFDISQIIKEAYRDNIEKKSPKIITNSISEIKYSLCVYQKRRKVPFLVGEFYDSIYAYILILEYKNYIAIFKNRTSSIDKILSENGFELLKYEELLKIMDNKAEVKRLSLRNMTMAKEAIHSRSYETVGNLNGVLSMHTAGRSIPNGIKFVTEEKELKSLTVSTGRIIESLVANPNNLGNIELLCDWCKMQLDIIIDTTPKENDFISKFSRPRELSELLFSDMNFEYEYIIKINEKKYKDTNKNKICKQKTKPTKEECEKVKKIIKKEFFIKEGKDKLFDENNIKIGRIKDNENLDIPHMYVVPKNCYKKEKKIILNPKAMLIESYKIRELIDNGEIILYLENEESVFDFLEKVHIIDKVQDKYILQKKEKIDIYSGELKHNKKTLTFDIPFLNNVKIKEKNAEKEISLQQFIIKKKMYSIVFDNINYMYYDGRCFEDTSGVSDIGSILNCMEEQEKYFEDVIEEKGEVSKDSTEFDETTMFYAVEQIHKDDDYIFLDDLGTEWCDHITINRKNKTINFIHSKVKTKKDEQGIKQSITSLSASNLQDVVGQGIKNLGNMRFSLEEFKRVKEEIILNDKYKPNEKNKKDVISDISRIRIPKKQKLDTTDFEKIENVINDYLTYRVCILSYSFLSKEAIEKEFEKIQKGEFVTGYVTQLFWILSSFIHACRGADVVPKIYCMA